MAGVRLRTMRRCRVGSHRTGSGSPTVIQINRPSAHT